MVAFLAHNPSRSVPRGLLQPPLLPAVPAAPRPHESGQTDIVCPAFGSDGTRCPARIDDTQIRELPALQLIRTHKHTHITHTHTMHTLNTFRSHTKPNNTKSTHTYTAHTHKHTRTVHTPTSVHHHHLHVSQSSHGNNTIVRFINIIIATVCQPLKTIMTPKSEVGATRRRNNNI